ncbi:MAG: S-methyl-5-thioribose-1-phosphate isomerase [Sulfobacillus sp.]
MLKVMDYEPTGLRILDQTLLPGRTETVLLTSPAEVARAITRLAVRGAPAIGVAAAYGLALAVDPKHSLSVGQRRLKAAAHLLKAARPTAVNLAWAVDRLMAERSVQSATDTLGLRRALEQAAAAMEAEDRRFGEAMAAHGADLLTGVRGILTHCNTGALATAGPGTALAVIMELWRRGERPAVYADETRPLLQGARLTSFELTEAGIAHQLLVDGAAAWLLAQGSVDAVIVGADRICKNGDVANKIGTYGLALSAKAHQVPFYVAAPSSTFDPSLAHGKLIPIEQRAQNEVLSFAGRRVAASGASAWNPAFDVTPGNLVAGYITEVGVLQVENGIVKWPQARTGPKEATRA